ncbi:MAG TPA: helix-turn-helix domain-containing protein [Myxococcales bacterium]|nr:helix-turn-helix domain-containing protein [Myxococcales bacterium]
MARPEGVEPPARGFEGVPCHAGVRHGTRLLTAKREKGEKGLHLVPESTPLTTLLTPAQVAERLGVCRETVYRLVALGELPATRVGSVLRIASADLDAYIRR